jgi:hypothetical protein
VDIRQVEEQFALNLANCVFSDAPNAKILTAVAITRGPIGEFLAGWNSASPFKCPFAVVRVTGGTEERDAASHASGSMGLGVREFMRATVVVVAGSVNDPLTSPPPFATSVGNVTGDTIHGQGAIVGKGVVIGTQVGQGVDRVATEVVRQCFGNGLLLDNVFGVQGRVVGENDLQQIYGTQLVGRAITFEIQNGSTQQSYHAPTRFKAAVGGATVTSTWLGVPSRPDFYQYVLKRDGGQIYAGPLLTFADVGVAPGAHTYTLVAQYDDVGRPPAAANRSSAVLSNPVTV